MPVQLNWTFCILCLSFLCLLTTAVIRPSFALEPEPRKWNHLPVDKNFGAFAFAHTEADIFFDPALRLEDVEMSLDTWLGKYIRSFEFFEKSARIEVTQAYQKGRWKGLLDGVPASTSRQGLSDTFVRVAMSLYGAPPLRNRDFGVYRSGLKTETIVGIALTVRLPTGDYKEDKLINLGQNRFVFRPQVGILHRRGKWTTEMTGEVAFHTKNDEFFHGNTLEQSPLYIVHGHLIYTIESGQWVAISAGYDYGGENRLNAVAQHDTQKNIGWKLSYAHPINRLVGARFFYLGTRTQADTGRDSDTLAASLSFVW